MKDSKIMVLKYKDKELRVVVDRNNPWFFIDDIVEIADLHEKWEAMINAMLGPYKASEVKFESVFVTGPDGTESLHDITNTVGAENLAYYAFQFGAMGCDSFEDPYDEFELFRDWFEKINTLIENQWERRVKDYCARMEREEKTRDGESETEMLHEITPLDQTQDVDATESTTA
jgi:hypothetical protein